MKITKELKHATFEWDDEGKTFSIQQKDGDGVVLNKVYAFAFMRFVVRMAQRNWLRNLSKRASTEETSRTTKEDSTADASQLLMFGS